MKTEKNTDQFIQTYNGHAFYPKTGKVTSIDLEDVAHSLSNLCRFSGHCREFYSVAEHSVLVSRIAADLWPTDKNTIWAALLHDATEAYVGDLTSPIKSLLPEFSNIENVVAEDIARKFKIEWDTSTLSKVKIADMIALATEARLLFQKSARWPSLKGYFPRLDLLEKKSPLSNSEARNLFLKEFSRLQKNRNAVTVKKKQK